MREKDKKTMIHIDKPRRGDPPPLVQFYARAGHGISIKVSKHAKGRKKGQRK